uniref:(northern house mosquito) hypothetical protein n=1 Tax=Culex pipiens TaxID=7175 RepID=A0A8D8NE65_CULPI
MEVPTRSSSNPTRVVPIRSRVVPTTMATTTRTEEVAVAQTIQAILSSSNQINKHLPTHKVPPWNPSTPCPSRRRSTSRSKRCVSDNNSSNNKPVPVPEESHPAIQTRFLPRVAAAAAPVPKVNPRNNNNQRDQTAPEVHSSSRVHPTARWAAVAVPIRTLRSGWAAWEWVRTAA